LLVFFISFTLISAFSFLFLIFLSLFSFPPFSFLSYLISLSPLNYYLIVCHVFPELSIWRQCCKMWPVVRQLPRVHEWITCPANLTSIRHYST
jgi:hypothetical protein